MSYSGNARETFRIQPAPDEERAQAAERRISKRMRWFYATVIAFSVVVILIVAVFKFKPDVSSMKQDVETTEKETLEEDCDGIYVYRGEEREIPPLFQVSTVAEKSESFRTADTYYIVKQMEDAFRVYNAILQKLPNSFRANYGVARIYEWNAYRLDYRTESIQNLVNASIYYLNALDNVHKGVTEDIVKKIELRLIDIYEDTGKFEKATRKANELIDKYPNDPYYLDRLARLYLKKRRFPEVINECFRLQVISPSYAMVNLYLGEVNYIQGQWEYAVENLFHNIPAPLPKPQQAIYYEALGDSLQRLGRKQDAITFYEAAVERLVFQQIYKRSSINEYGLKDKPWWSVKDFEGTDEGLIFLQNFYRELMSYSNVLREELQSALNRTRFRKHVRDTEYYQVNHIADSVREVLVYDRGYKTSICSTFPRLTRLFDTFFRMRKCWKCNVKYLLISKAHIWPTCKKINNLVTTHLALSVPNNVSIRVHNEIRTWTEGNVLIFDGTFEHEIWNNGSGVLMLLSFDTWNFKLTENEIRKFNYF